MFDESALTVSVRMILETAYCCRFSEVFNGSIADVSLRCLLTVVTVSVRMMLNVSLLFQ